jgi:hypothetical protein
VNITSNLRIPITSKPYAVVFKWKDAKPGVLDVQEYFETEGQANTYLLGLKGKLPKGVEFAGVMKWE